MEINKIIIGISRRANKIAKSVIKKDYRNTKYTTE